MSLHDRDLLSIQQARDLLSRASEAQKKFARFSQQQVDAVVEACAEAALAAVEPLARLAVEETGYGNVADKVIKNRLAAVDVPRAIRGMKTVGILHEDAEKGIIEIAEPLGVVAAVIPTTNPTSTAIYKILISIKARNAVVLSPHPSAIRCICESAAVLTRAALRAGAPEGLIGCMQHVTTQGTQELMRNRQTGVILATGGTGLVRAAYSSGRPAYGVGPGNVPAYIERTADVRKAVADIIAGKTFDYGTICSSEQCIVADQAIAEQALEECRRQGAYFVSSEEAEKLSRLVIDPVRQVPNARIVGRPATVIAEVAGFQVPPSTRVLIARLETTQVGREHPLSLEKLSPILAFYVVPNTAAAIELCNRLLSFGGAGHTIAVHTQNEPVAREFGQAVAAYRVCVNTSAVHGSIGYSTNLFPAMTLGCGAPGGNITSDNIGPLHLLNRKRIAWESRSIEHRTIPADQRMAGPSATAPAPSQDGAALRSSVIASPDRGVIARIVERVMMEHGIARGGARAEPAGAATATANSPSPAEQPAQSKPAAPLEEKAPPAPEMAVAAFVSESDVRSALTRREKIFIGPRTIVTPSARDLGLEHQVFVETQP